MRLKEKPIFYSICSCNDRDSLVGYSVAVMLLLHVVSIKSVNLFACFSRFCCCLLIFSKKNFLQNYFRNTVQVSNSLDPNQDRQNVGPDLGPNCLQRLSADDKVTASKERVITYVKQDIQGSLSTLISKSANTLTV